MASFRNSTGSCLAQLQKIIPLGIVKPYGQRATVVSFHNSTGSFKAHFDAFSHTNYHTLMAVLERPWA